MDGILMADKPAGLTSHDIVAWLRRITGESKVGHTGTLDPLATGVLVLCLGAATKALPYLPEGDKTYQAEAQLGASTDTQDRTGRIIEENREFSVAHDDLRRALAGFLGDGTQLPPMYSAVQVGGERLYRLARAGCEVARPERQIKIGAIRLDWPEANEHPVFRHGDRFGFTVTANRGFYVRTLCHDLGQRLGCGAHLAELRRLASGPFLLEHAVSLAGLTREEVEKRLIPIGAALGYLPAVHLEEQAAQRVAHGNPIPNLPPDPSPARGGEKEPLYDKELARAVDVTGRTIAVLKRRGEYWQPVRVF